MTLPLEFEAVAAAQPAASAPSVDTQTDRAI
jgi:hypothetical protein